MSVFTKLSHPVERLLRELPAADGLEIHSLLDFLPTVIKIRTFFSIPDKTLLEIIYSYCRESLSGRVNAALVASLTFGQFHMDLLRFFVPRRMFDVLKQDLFGRLQGQDESFSAYVNSIKDTATILQLPVSEGEIVANILEGLSPGQRTRFVFQPCPDSLEALDRICVHDQNISFADQSRSRARTSLVFSPRVPVAVNNERQPTNFSFPSAPSTATPVTKFCFYCKGTRHFKKHCRKWLRDHLTSQAMTRTTENSA